MMRLGTSFDALYDFARASLSNNWTFRPARWPEAGGDVKVYIVMAGDYDGAWIEGVFASPAAAHAAFPGDWPEINEHGVSYKNDASGLRIYEEEVRQ
jgi:hypothetical protein